MGAVCYWPRLHCVDVYWHTRSCNLYDPDLIGVGFCKPLHSPALSQLTQNNTLMSCSFVYLLLFQCSCSADPVGASESAEWSVCHWSRTVCLGSGVPQPPSTLMEWLTHICWILFLDMCLRSSIRAKLPYVFIQRFGTSLSGTGGLVPCYPCSSTLFPE